MSGRKRGLVGRRGMPPEDWPDWVLVPQVHGETFTTQLAAFLAWKERRNAWALEHAPGFVTEHRGRHVFGRFIDAAVQEARRRGGGL